MVSAAVCAAATSAGSSAPKVGGESLRTRPMIRLPVCRADKRPLDFPKARLIVKTRSYLRSMCYRRNYDAFFDTKLGDPE